MSFVHENLAVHYITKSTGFTYIVVADGSINHRVPFLFLLNLEESFENKYGIGSGDEISAGIGTKNDFLSSLRKLTDGAERGDNNSIGLANSELDQVKNIMIENVERVLERGDRINLLVSKTDRMNSNAVAFRKRSAGLQRKMWWQNVKYSVLLIVLAIVVIYLLLGLVCGFPGYSLCFAY